MKMATGTPVSGVAAYEPAVSDAEDGANAGGGVSGYVPTPDSEVDSDADGGGDGGSSAGLSDPFIRIRLYNGERLRIASYDAVCKGTTIVVVQGRVHVAAHLGIFLVV